MRKIDTIIIHCSATRPSWMRGKPFKEQVREIKRWHTEERGWSDIGYHYLISREGTVRKGRPIDRTGAHTRGHNKGSVGICLIGGHGGAKTDKFLDHFTNAQWNKLHALLNDLEAKHGKLAIHGHNEFAAKGCPSFDVQKEIISIRGVKADPITQFFKRLFRK